MAPAVARGLRNRVVLNVKCLLGPINVARWVVAPSLMRRLLFR